MSADERMKAVRPHPNVCLLACTLCGVLVWDFDAHYTHAHSTPGENREEQNR